MIRTMLAHYELTSQLGKGGMREVYQAKDHEWFCDGIAKEILNPLAPLKGLRVAARTSAVSTLEVATAMAGRNSISLASQAGVFRHWGKPSEARALQRELLERASRTYVPLAHLALTAEAARQHDEALELARCAWDDRKPPFILNASHFPEYSTLRSDTRFAEILGEMNEQER
jgi:hypothetical protein